MDEPFRGFTENDDEVKAALQDKLTEIRKLTNETQSVTQPSHWFVTEARRPVNRFLKRSEALSSSNSIVHNYLGLGSPSSIKSTPSLQLESPTSVEGSTGLPDLLIVADKPDLTPPLKRVNKFLKSERSAISGCASVKPKPSTEVLGSPRQISTGTTDNTEPDPPPPKLIRMVQSQPSEPSMETGTVPVELEVEENQEVRVEENDTKSLEPDKSNLDLKNVKTKLTADLISVSKVDKTSAEVSKTDDKQLLQPSAAAPATKQDSKSTHSASSSKSKVSKPPSPAKVQRAVSTPTPTPELSFLTSQSSRSKRTIIPNKRFFSTDDSDTVSPTATASNSAPIPDPKTVPPSPSEFVAEKPKRISIPNKRFFSTDDFETVYPVAASTSAPAPIPSPKTLPQSDLGAEKPKRTIIPNKRFSETVAASISAQISNSTTKTLPQTNLGVEKSKPSKKRTLSGGDTVGGNNAKKIRRPSMDTHPKTNGTNSTATEIPTVKPSPISPTPSDPNGRPRRTIIPNKKFVDEEIPSPSKDVLMSPIKKQVEVVVANKTVPVVAPIPETKKKRKKSEKSEPEAANNTESSMHQTIMEMAVPLPVVVEAKKSDQCETGANSKTNAASLAPLESEGKVEAPQTHMMNGNGNVLEAIPNGAKVEKEIPPDEEAIDEGEASLFRGKPQFLGTCIVKISETSNEQCSADVARIICCGICGCVKKYKFPSEKRKRGSFLCRDCITVVNKIFQVALKAQPFSWIVGPPVCEGRCPLVHLPQDQFCQACFGKSCLKNLPLKDDVYFKIWRSVPAMSRGCVPTCPAINSHSPHIGKIALVNDDGEISSTTGSLKLIRSKKNGTDASSSGGYETGSEDSCSLPETTPNPNEDLNSARLKVLQRTGSFDPSSNNCENIPLKNNLLVTECSETDIMPKSNGVSKEEILLGRQIGQERVKALVDSIYKPDLDAIGTSGFPVVVAGSSYPRKPLCFLCGSAGIEQLIYCSMCCEPYHPYCSGDDLLLDTYIARCSSKEIQLISSIEDNPEESATSKIVLKWTCRRCISCKSCGDNIGSKELIRCSRCQHPFHLQTCIDKPILSKVKDVDKLRKVWTCDTCLKCKSCGKKIESNRRVQTIQQAAAAAKSSDEESDSEEEDGKSSSEEVGNPMPSCLMLCLDCFKQRKKGSFCPICEVCYDDNDWDSKMMECSQCNRWIHSTCENLNEEQYNILGRLPEYIEYVCRLCHNDQVDSPLWFTAVQSQLVKECASALRLFERKALGSLRRKRSSVSLDSKPHFVCNLFGEKIDEEEENEDCAGLSILEKPVNHSPDQKKNSPRSRIYKVGQKGEEKSVSYKELVSCDVTMRDVLSYPANLEENWYVLKALRVEVLNPDVTFQSLPSYIDTMPRTPICTTPVKCFTPTKHVASIADSMRNSIGSIRSLHTFQRLLLQEIEDTCDTEEEADVLMSHLYSAVRETFPWFDQPQIMEHAEIEPSLIDSEATTDVPEESCDVELFNEKRLMLTSDPFKEVFWNPLNFFDDRPCVLCGEVGDFPPEMCGRLLWCGVNEWIHCNCAIWSSEVYEEEDGALKQIGGALNRGKIQRCKVCLEKGATVSCCFSSCKNSYHFLCARNANCILMENKTMFCSHHKLSDRQKNDSDIQHDFKVGRKMFVDLDWIHKRGVMKVLSDEVRVFVGSLKIERFGSIVPISITEQDWEDSSSATLLIPRDFQAQRIFWSVEYPWKKECYIFGSSVDDSSCFIDKVQDIGVNISVDHEAPEDRIQRGLHGINSFHRWLSQAPRYIDEESIDWLPSCQQVFYKEEKVEVVEEEEEFQVERFQLLSSSKRQSSPSSSSVSSFESCRKALNFSQSLNLTCKPRDFESVSTEGYASSAESLSFMETPKSSKISRSQQKRRRSSCKTRKTPKRHCKITPPPPSSSSNKYESPRRRSMRNRIAEKSSMEEFGKEESGKTYDESENDSGVVECGMEGSSTAGSCDGERMQCRVNLLKRFSESFERPAIQEDRNQLPDPGDDDESSVYFTASDGEHVMLSDDASTIKNEKVELSPQLPEESKGSLIIKARLKFELRRNHDGGPPLFEGFDAHLVWMRLFEEVSRTRQAHNFSPLSFPFINRNLCDGYMEKANSFQLLGITHRSVQFIIEQLPGVINIADQHQFRYSSRPYVNINDENRPVPVNPSGSARTEGGLKRKPYDMFGWLASRHRKVNMICNMSEESGRSQGLPIAMQFRDLGKKSKERFVVLHSEIHGRGLFSRCDVEKGEMLIEYAGEVIRSSLTDPREKYYESRGIGCYMFRIKTQVVDATMKGNAARFINHSCEPNCEAKTIRILGSDHIIIFALRKIFKGEELTYDYKFEREGEEKKLLCSCGAARCRKYMN